LSWLENFVIWSNCVFRETRYSCNIFFASACNSINVWGRGRMR